MFDSVVPLIREDGFVGYDLVPTLCVKENVIAIPGNFNTISVNEGAGCVGQSEAFHFRTSGTARKGKYTCNAWMHYLKVYSKRWAKRYIIQTCKGIGLTILMDKPIMQEIQRRLVSKANFWVQFVPLQEEINGCMSRVRLYCMVFVIIVRENSENWRE